MIVYNFSAPLLLFKILKAAGVEFWCFLPFPFFVCFILDSSFYLLWFNLS